MFFSGLHITGGGLESHCRPVEYYLGQTPLSFFISGNSGVMIFLILTGFGTYLVCERGKESSVKYASLRFFKLAVLMFISTITNWMLFKFHLVYYPHIVGHTNTIWIQGESPFNNNIISLIWGNWFTISTSYNNTLWTMQYIFFGSVICIIIYDLWGELKKGYIVPSIIGVCFVIMGPPYFVACILGYILAHYYKKNADRQIGISWGIGLLLPVPFLCGYPMLIESQFFLYRILPEQYVEYYHMAGAFLLIYVCLFCSPVKKMMENRFFLKIGKYSMSIYTMHFTLLMSVTSYLFVKLINRFSYNKAVLLVWVFTCFITFVVAILLKKIIDSIYRWLDRAYIKLYHYMTE